MSDFQGLQPINLASKRPNCIAFSGLKAAAWLSLSGKTWTLARHDSYETPIKNGFLMDLVSGDLNGDGQKDLLFIEGNRNHLDIVKFEAPDKLLRGQRWQVFEERTFRNARTNSPEPREARIADLTGDGKNDIAIIVHDRILLYPQE